MEGLVVPLETTLVWVWQGHCNTIPPRAPEQPAMQKSWATNTPSSLKFLKGLEMTNGCCLAWRARGLKFQRWGSRQFKNEISHVARRHLKIWAVQKKLKCQSASPHKKKTPHPNPTPPHLPFCNTRLQTALSCLSCKQLWWHFTPDLLNAPPGRSKAVCLR